ncbi:MAG: hypothetical protein ACI8QS_001865 [Planctomycetota bacterium]|jgi:hypothetical protein
MPHLRALVQRMQDRPFALVGVNSYDEAAAYHEGVEEFGLTWPTIFQGGSTPVADLYRVQGYPSVFLLDEEGKILSLSLRGQPLVDKVEELVTALEKRSL